MTIIAKHIEKRLGEQNNLILSDINLEINQGEFVALTGKSGSGKSTLLYVLSTLDPPTKGQVQYGTHSIGNMSEKAVRQFRNQNIGFVFQFHYLLPELTAYENVLMPAMKNGVKAEHKKRAMELVSLVGLEDRAHQLPRHLSGGQNQRVAIARSLMMKPKYLFADEPTGSLDSENSARVFHIFQTINKELGATIIMVTHDQDLAAASGRQIVLKDGKII